MSILASFFPTKLAIYERWTCLQELAMMASIIMPIPAASKESLPSVTAAGVVAVLFGVFGVFGSVLAGLSMMLVPQLPTQPGAPPMPAEARSMAAAMMFFLFALAVFGIFVGIGVIRRRNWARISILICGGLMTFFCLAVLTLSLIVFSAGLGIDLPNNTPDDVGRVMPFVKLFLVVLYGIPAGVGIWWLVLFTRKRVAAVFTDVPAQSEQVMDASGFPQLAPSATPQSNRPTCPVPLTVVAAFLILGAVSMVLLFAFFPFYSAMPLFLFGRFFSGVSARSFFLVLGLLSGAAGIGILKLKPWALYTQIGLQFFGLLNCAATLFSPNYGPAMRQMMQKIYSNNPAFAPGSPLLSDGYFRGIMLFSTLMIGAILALLLWQRPRFLELAAASKA